MNKLFITITIILLSLLNMTAVAQKKNKKFKINDDIRISEIKIYLYFPNRGFTTATAYTHFNELKKSVIETILLNDTEVLRIQNILNKSFKKKHWPTKVGQNIIFFEMKLNTANFYNRVIITNSQDGYILVDLSRNINFFIKDKEDVEWLSAIIDRVRKNE